jgi:hypothetical protein
MVSIAPQEQTVVEGIHQSADHRPRNVRHAIELAGGIMDPAPTGSKVEQILI